MTLWERVERLEKRLGELEAQPRITLDGFDGRCDTMSQRVDELEELIKSAACAGAVQASINAINTRVVALEAQPRITLDGDGELRKRIARIDGMNQRLAMAQGEQPKAVVYTPESPRCPCEDDDVCLMVRGSKAHPWGLEAIERGEQARLLEDVSVFLQMFMNWYYGDGPSLEEVADLARALLARDLARASLARARVAGEKP